MCLPPDVSAPTPTASSPNHNRSPLSPPLPTSPLPAPPPSRRPRPSARRPRPRRPGPRPPPSTPPSCRPTSHQPRPRRAARADVVPAPVAPPKPSSSPLRLRGWLYSRRRRRHSRVASHTLSRAPLVGTPTATPASGRIGEGCFTCGDGLAAVAALSDRVAATLGPSMDPRPDPDWALRAMMYSWPGGLLVVD
ncbi:hypothetical protein ACP70R_033569 [Stipagrostis hirtigluma subsp. patula]